MAVFYLLKYADYGVKWCFFEGFVRATPVQVLPLEVYIAL
jgi:hypothetical protein